MAACRDQAKPSPRLAGLLLAVGFALSEKGWKHCHRPGYQLWQPWQSSLAGPERR